MSVIPVILPVLQQNLQNDCQEWRRIIGWAKDRYGAYNQNCQPSVMASLGLSQADQNAITAFVGDLNRFIILSGGTLPSDADDMEYNLRAIIGVY